MAITTTIERWKIALRTAVTNAGGTPLSQGSENEMQYIAALLEQLSALVGSSGTTDHAALTHLGWTSSGHTGTASKVAGFAAVTGAAAEKTIGAGLDIAAGTHASQHQNGGADEVATATPGANAIPKAGAGGTLAAGWIPAATTSAAGGVQLATDGEVNGAEVPVANDMRLMMALLNL